MTESSGSKRKASAKNDSESREDVIELSDIAVGISSEDEEIIDLTEEIVVGAIEGFSGARGEAGDDKEILDLSRIEETVSDATKTAERDAEEIPLEFLNTTADFREDIEQKLDSYFLTEEEAGDQSFLESEPESESVEATVESKSDVDMSSITSQQIEAALENVIKKMFADKIDQMLEEVIERSVSQELEVFKKLLSTRAASPEKS